MGDPVPSSAISDATTGGLSVIVITGGSTGDVLTKQSNGTYAPVTPSSGGSPGGSSGQVQYNNAGAFGGMTAVVYAGTGTHLAITSQAASTIPLSIKGAASQSAVLTEWRNSAGTLLCYISTSKLLLNCASGFNTISFFSPGNGWTCDFTGHSEGECLISGFTGVIKFNISTQGNYFNLGNGIGISVARSTSPTGGSITATSGTGTNIAAATLDLSPGRSTGNATPGCVNLNATAVGSSGTSLQTLSTVLQITNSTLVTVYDGVNFKLDTTTGSKIGTAANQKLGFWNATPVVQQVLATGASRTVDDVISLLQTLGLCKQS